MCESQCKLLGLVHVRQWVSSVRQQRVEDVQDRTLCSITLKAEDGEALREAIEDLYYFEFIIGAT